MKKVKNSSSRRLLVDSSQHFGTDDYNENFTDHQLALAPRVCSVVESLSDYSRRATAREAAMLQSISQSADHLSVINKVLHTLIRTFFPDHLEHTGGLSIGVIDPLEQDEVLKGQVATMKLLQITILALSNHLDEYEKIKWMLSQSVSRNDEGHDQPNEGCQEELQKATDDLTNALLSLQGKDAKVVVSSPWALSSDNPMYGPDDNTKEETEQDETEVESAGVWGEEEKISKD